MVYICFRNDETNEIARLLMDQLIQRGYDVFNSVESLAAGAVQVMQFSEIDKCIDFILFLPPNGLDRCINDENDWVRQEVAYAIARKKNIIPVMMNGFDWPNQLPQIINDLPFYTGVTIDMLLFDSVIENICRLLKSEPVHPPKTLLETKEDVGANSGFKLLGNFEFLTNMGSKSIEIYDGDMTCIPQDVDILVVSSFKNCYYPLPGTLIGALYEKVNIDVNLLSEDPEINLRDTWGTWLSRKIGNQDCRFKRVACTEILGGIQNNSIENYLPIVIKNLFILLQLAQNAGISIHTIAMLLLGVGAQGIQTSKMLEPLMEECANALNYVKNLKKIVFVEKNQENAKMLFTAANKYQRQYSAACLENVISKSVPWIENDKTVFISYSSKDKVIADNLCEKIESKGIKVWYAPRNIVASDFSSCIMAAIKNSKVFVVIISDNAQQSQHVLSEIHEAFNRLQNGLVLMPLIIDEMELSDSIQYYINRQEWIFATKPPIDDKLNMMAEKIRIILQ